MSAVLARVAHAVTPPAAQDTHALLGGAGGVLRLRPAALQAEARACVPLRSPLLGACTAKWGRRTMSYEAAAAAAPPPGAAQHRPARTGKENKRISTSGERQPAGMQN